MEYKLYVVEMKTLCREYSFNIHNITILKVF